MNDIFSFPVHMPGWEEDQKWLRSDDEQKLAQKQIYHRCKNEHVYLH